MGRSDSIRSAVTPVLAVGPLRRRAFALAGVVLKSSAMGPSRALARVSEKASMRLGAALLDLGNHMMLPADERKALRLRWRLSSQRARRLGIKVAATKAGARKLDEVTLEIPINERAQESNPGRKLALSCVVYGPLAPTRAPRRRTYPRSSGAL